MSPPSRCMRSVRWCRSTLRWARRRGFERAGIWARAFSLSRSGLAGSCAGNGSRKARGVGSVAGERGRPPHRHWSRRSIIAAMFRSRGKTAQRLKATFSIAVEWNPARRQLRAIVAERWISQDKDFLRRDCRPGFHRARHGCGQELGKLGAPLLGKEGGGRERYFAAAGEAGVAAVSTWQLALSVQHSVLSIQHSDLNCTGHD